MSNSLTVDGRNSNYTNAQIAEFVRTHKPEEIAKAAAEAGVGLKQISEATGHSVETLSGSARQLGYEIKKDGAARSSVDLTMQSSTPFVKSPNAISITPIQAIPVREAVHGEGNKDISDEEIQAWFAEAPRSPEDVMAAMVHYGVSAKQAGHAMGYSDLRIEQELVNYGLDKEALNAKQIENLVAIRPEQAETVFEVVHGAGNDNVSDEDIRAWANAHPAATPDEVVEAMVSYGVSANQVGKALGLDQQHLQVLVAEYGLTSVRLASVMTQGWTKEDFNKYLAEHPDKVDAITDSNEAFGTAIGRTNTLLDEARIAEDAAAVDQAGYDALNAKFAPAFAMYNGYAQEISGLESSIQTEQGQKDAALNTLAHLDQIEEKRDRRATAQREAEYQVGNSDQNIAKAQERINYLRGQMQEMEGWGIPLMEQTQAAKAKWDASAAVAAQKQEIASAQGGVAQQAANQNKADVASVIFSGQAMSTWLSENPDFEKSEQVNQVLKDTVPVLEETMEDQRGWVDGARARGLELEADAVELENLSTTAKGGLDSVQPGRLQSEADIAGKQSVYNDAVAAENKAQTDLDAAYKQRDQANYGGGRGERNRLRDEAERLITHLKTVLSEATQKRATAEAELNQAKTGGFSAIAAGVEEEAKWQGTVATAANARNQALSELAVGTQIFDLESNTTGALASVYSLMIDNSKTESALAQDLSSTDSITLTELNTVEDKVQENVKFALSGLTTLQQTSTADRIVADNERKALVPLQAEAYGLQLIVNDKLNDVTYLNSVRDSMQGVPTLQANVVAAEERLNKAKLAVTNADMHMDWAEDRTNAKGQAKDMAKAQPILDAAKQELVDAQQNYDAAVAQLNSGKYLDAPLRNMAIESNWSATSSYIDADTASARAMTQGGWTSIAQNRYWNVDGIVASAQALIVQNSTELSEIQNEMSEEVSTSDPTAAQILKVQSDWNKQWADDFRNLSVTTRQAEQKTYEDQATLDNQTIQIAGLDAFGIYQKGKVEKLEKEYEAIKGTLPGLEATFLASSQQAQTDSESAEAARNNMTDQELNAMVEFVRSRKEDKNIDFEALRAPAIERLTENEIAAYNGQAEQLLTEDAKKNGIESPTFTDEQIQQTARQLYAQANGGVVQPAFTEDQVRRASLEVYVDNAQDAEMAKRKTMRKQLHYVDDRQMWIDADPTVQAARSGALQVAKTAEASTQTAINDGEALQAGTFMAMLQGQRLGSAATSWGETTAAAAQLATEAVQQADLVAEDYSNEKTIQQNMLDGMTNYLNGNVQLAQMMSDQAKASTDPEVAQLMANQSKNLEDVTQAHIPVLQNTASLVELAGQMSTDAATYAGELEGTAAELQKVADQAAEKAKTIQSMVEEDGKNFEEMYQKTAEGLAKVYGLHDWAVAIVREHADKALAAKELHEDRLAADAVHKKLKKKGIIKWIKMAVATIAAIAVSVFSFGTAAPAAGAFLTTYIGATLGTIAGGVIAGAATAVVTQGINMALGLQDKFSPLSVAMGAISGGITMGVFSQLGTVNNIIGSATRATSELAKDAVAFTSGAIVGGGSSFATQAVFKAAGWIDEYSWTDVANMAVIVGGMGVINSRLAIGKAASERISAESKFSPWKSFVEGFADDAARSYRLASAGLELVASTVYLPAGKKVDFLTNALAGLTTESVGAAELFDGVKHNPAPGNYDPSHNDLIPRKPTGLANNNKILDAGIISHVTSG